MKTKIASLCAAAVFSILAFATSSSAAEEGFYDKDHIRGFVSFGADFRGMTDAFNDYVNKVAFAGLNGGTLRHKADTSSSVYRFFPTPTYNTFNQFYPALHFNIGAQYKQFLTWFDINFAITQISERPYQSKQKKQAKGDGWDGMDENGKIYDFPLYDARWFNYGADWMFGWKILGEDEFFNLIPAVGIGFNMMNIHFTSNYIVTNTSSSEEIIMRDRYYSTIAATFNAELEARIQLEQFSVGLYGGYRVVRYNELNVEGSNLDTENFNTDNDGDTWFVGLRFTWTFLSPWAKKQQDKL